MKKHGMTKRVHPAKDRGMDFIDLDEKDFDEDEFDDEYDDELDDEYDDEDYDDEYDDDEEYEDEYDDEEFDDEYDESDEYDDDEEYDDPEDEYDDYEDNEYDEEYEDDEDSYGEYDDYDRYDDGYEAYPYDEPTGIRGFFASKSTLDLVIMGSGIVAALLLVVVGVIFLRKAPSGTQSDIFADFGSEMEGIDIIGHDGLIAMADTNSSRLFAAREAEAQALAEIFEEETDENKEEDKHVVVIMNLTSIQKDLKIKFVNNNSKRLVTGVNFEVTVTDPSGSKSTQKDTDADGIIYLKDITPGSYKVSLVGPESDDFSFSKDSVSIKVKDTIEYKKVDVVDEIKSEKEINAAAEDTAQAIETESTLKDTVEWVESSKSAINENVTYTEVSKGDISDPGKTASLDFRLLSKRFENNTGDGNNGQEGNEGENNGSEGSNPGNEGGNGEGGNGGNSDPTPEPAADPTATPTSAPEPTSEPTAAPTRTPEPTSAPTPTATPKATATKEPTATPKATETPTPKVTPTVTPTVSPTPTASAKDKAMKDTTSVLKTTKGEVLYIKDGDKYIEAKYADYYKEGIKFYKKVTKGEYRYTGWQTIDGNTYFYDKTGKPVTGEQVIQGAKYVFGSDGVLSSSSGVLGIDVSKWNGSINWDSVKKSGVSYVIIRCGYRGSSTGALVADPQFKANINGAKEAGLKVGVYFYSQAVNEIEAVEEASMAVSLINGYSLSYPVFIDVEGSKGRGDQINADQRTAVCKAFCQTVQNSGYKAGVYSNKTWLTSYLNISSLSGYKVWLAQYASTPTYNKSRYDIWQYSSKGSIPGISGNVDMNISYMGY